MASPMAGLLGGMPQPGLLTGGLNIGIAGGATAPEALLAAGVSSPRADQRSPNALLGVPDTKLQPGNPAHNRELLRRQFFGTLGIPGVMPSPPLQNVDVGFLG